ncbi:MAG: Ycf66 family protein [Phormidesmis sp.]
MFAHVLAVLLGSGSLGFYLAAFLYPEVHRRSDFLWAGLGLLYAAVLWFSAGQMTGLVLLGQVVAVALLLGLGWQTLTVRREKTPVYQQTPIVLTPEVVGGWAKSKLNELRIAPDESVRSVRLERRAIEGPAALSARLDPRRRPAYDYEFVEDGVELAEAQQGELFSTAFAGETAALSEDLDEAVAEIAYAAPPAAEAEVVAVEEPVIEEAVAEENVVEEAVAEENVVEEVVAEADVAEEAVSEEIIPEDAVLEDAVLEDAIAEALEPEKIRLEERESQPAEWTDVEETLAESPADEAIDAQWIEPVSTAASKPKPLSTAVDKKPSLLAMPVILVGWVKDVVVSMTKPKPSKPMIEIPRREASVSRVSVQAPVVSRSSEGDSRYNDELEDDDWEDSNWAD